MTRCTRRAFVAGLLALSVGGCTEPSDPLTGLWIEIQSSSVSHPARTLDLTRGRSFDFTIGVPPIFTRISGFFTVKGSSITFDAIQVESRSGADSPSTIVPYADAPAFENATFGFDGGDLVLNYTSYPADGPVPTIMRLKRVLPRG